MCSCSHSRTSLCIYVVHSCMTPKDTYVGYVLKGGYLQQWSQNVFKLRTHMLVSTVQPLYISTMQPRFVSRCLVEWGVAFSIIVSVNYVRHFICNQSVTSTLKPILFWKFILLSLFAWLEMKNLIVQKNKYEKLVKAITQISIIYKLMIISTFCYSTKGMVRIFFSICKMT